MIDPTATHPLLRDLNDAHAAELRDALAGYVGHARKVPSSSGRRAGRKSASAASSSTGASAADVRIWARENGHEVPERGRIPADIREAYDAAH